MSGEEPEHVQDDKPCKTQTGHASEHNPARVAGGLPLWYNVQHVKSAKAPIAECFSSGRLVNFMRKSALRGDAYCVPSYAFPFGHTSRLDRTYSEHRLFAHGMELCNVNRVHRKECLCQLECIGLPRRSVQRAIGGLVFAR